uniref:TLC domain-containing protein n=2 Tax=Kalanchoe fedtschenkoi TaxID=63787 RepID=A0A7N0T2Q1_KALFE
MILLATVTAMTIKSFQRLADLLLKEYVLADSVIPYTSIITGIVACKLVYELTHMVSVVFFKAYSSLPKVLRVEWKNRGMSTVHSIYITIVALYFVFGSDLYSDRQPGLVTFRNSPISTFSLGVSVGYFIADLGMIFWFYPSLGGLEYVVHHLLSLVSLSFAMLTGEGQLYTYMVLISETTTPGVNMRWYLDTAGLKKSKAYVVNGIVMFFVWLVARILLFMYFFYHLYTHYDQVKELQAFGKALVFVVPYVLAVMNAVWFAKIVKGMMKTLAKKE